MSDQSAPTRTGWDLILGALLAVVGVVVLMHAVLATVVSVLFVGWLALISGVVTVVMSLFSIGKDGFWSSLLGGALIAVLGLVMVRNPGVAAVALTLTAGAMFLVSGIARLVAAVQIPEARVPLIVGGGISAVLGLMVLFNLFSASLTLIGVLLGIQTIAEGVAIMIAGRGTVRASRRASMEQALG